MATATPDAALIDGSGQLHVFINDRSGRFHEQPVPKDFSRAKTIAVADVNRNGVLALLAVRGDGAVVSLSETEEGKDWISAVIANVPDAANYLAHEVRLRVGDLDNNGAFDPAARFRRCGAECCHLASE